MKTTDFESELKELEYLTRKEQCCSLDKRERYRITELEFEYGKVEIEEDEEDVDNIYTFVLQDDGTLSIYENDRIMAEISDVNKENQFRIFKDVVYEMRGILL